MKRVMTKKGIIVTPWLKTDEAAAYCGLSTNAFIKHTKDLPYGGDSETRLYHVRILDAWMTDDA